MNSDDRIRLERTRKRDLLDYAVSVLDPCMRRVHAIAGTAMNNCVRADDNVSIDLLTGPYTRLAYFRHLLAKFIQRYSAHPSGIDLLEFELDLEPFLSFFQELYSMEWLFFAYTMSSPSTG